MSVRLAVEEAARDVLHSTVTVLGSTPLCRDDEHSRNVADLEVYLRQLDAGHAAQVYGADYAGGCSRGDPHERSPTPRGIQRWTTCRGGCTSE